MKIILSIILALALITPALTSCSDSDEESYGFIENATFDTSLLFGRWDVEFISEPEAGTFWNDLENWNVSLTFNKDGRFAAERTNGITGVWEEITSDYYVSGSVITLYLDHDITIEPTRIDEYDVYFIATYHPNNGSSQSVYCKGEKR